MTRLTTLVALVAFATVTTSACTTTRGVKRATIMTGAITAAAGGIALAAGAADVNHDGHSVSALDGDFPLYVLGGGLLVGGLGIMLGGAAASTMHEPVPPPSPPPYAIIPVYVPTYVPVYPTQPSPLSMR